MQLPSHAYCPNCDAIQRVALERLDQPDISGRYLGGDLICEFCGATLCTMYEPAEREKNDEPTEDAREGEAGRAPADPV